MNYRESRSFISDASKYGSVLSLDAMTKLMERLDNVQDSYPVIHVAGTNGKGSVSAFLYSVLQEAGYRVGRYNSPALFCYRERWSVSGEMITRDEFASCTDLAAKAAADMVSEGLPHPTVFEIETAVAFVWFARKNVDIAIIEVGMGGDRDATNVISKPLLSVITSIGMDHCEYLGKTVSEIAARKAGIIKKDCPVVSALQENAASEVIERFCDEAGVPLITADPKEAEILEEGYLFQRFRLDNKEYRIGLSGVHQIQNAVLAVRAAEILRGREFMISEEALKRGLEKTRWNGRFETIMSEPLFIIDGAHNPPAAHALAESLVKYFPEKAGHFIFIIGMFRDKDYHEVLRLTCHLADRIYTIETPGNRRACPAEKLCEAAALYVHGGSVEAMKSIEDAVRSSLKTASPDDVIVCFGSLSFLASVKRIIETEHY